MLRDLEKEKIVEAIHEGFEKNSQGPDARAQGPAGQVRRRRCRTSRRARCCRLTYVPGKGTTVGGSGEETVDQGKDFADALFSVWLGRTRWTTI